MTISGPSWGSPAGITLVASVVGAQGTCHPHSSPVWLAQLSFESHLLKEGLKCVPDTVFPGEEPGGGRFSSLFSSHPFTVSQVLTLNFSLVPQPSCCSFA